MYTCIHTTISYHEGPDTLQFERTGKISPFSKRLKHVYLSYVFWWTFTNASTHAYGRLDFDSRTLQPTHRQQSETGPKAHHLVNGCVQKHLIFHRVLILIRTWTLIVEEYGLRHAFFHRFWYIDAKKYYPPKQRNSWNSIEVMFSKHIQQTYPYIIYLMV